ncbi:MAG: acetyl-CoA carboxylase biotin carboxyl carrier protein [candidate division NC10 bacterium]|nr:acetyl-CoA carboxylase biotin carboxyl carrier protein [candidate division NC10 bacterium]
MDLKQIMAVLKLIQETDVEEIEVEHEGHRVRIRRRGAQGPVATPSPIPSASNPQAVAAVPSAPEIREATNLVTVESPMVGTFYRASAPGADAYVREGDKVENGTVLCLIEAMKLMNEIESEVRGTVRSILVENAQPVEYGQPLFLIEPA